MCTQASQLISLVLKAERRISVISEAEVRSFPNLLLHQLTKYSKLFFSALLDLLPRDPNACHLSPWKTSPEYHVKMRSAESLAKVTAIFTV